MLSLSRLRRSGAGVAAGLVLAALTPLAPLALTAPATAAPGICPGTSVKQQVGVADAVFRGVVKKVGAAHGSGKHRTRAYRVATDRVYQGSLAQRTVYVSVRTGGTSCTFLTGRLSKGQRYIVFAQEKGSLLMARVATGRADRTLTAKVVKLLGSGKQPETPGTSTAEFTKVADANPPRLSRLLAPGGAIVIISLLGLLVVGRLGRRSRA